ncbi:MAG: DivIVA domain-containing protein [Rhodothermia bacterium]|nr:DivIVA domain-containing protein [Rhodothermia bacterium]
MKLTPLDIKKQDFKRTMRGVDPEEVHAFLQMVADQWQDVSEENDRLERRIIELESKLTHYKQVEEAMQEALKTARHSSKQTLEAAKTKAKAIVEEAVAAATRIQKQAEDEKYRLRREIERIRSRRAEVIARLRALLNSELAILDDHEKQHPVAAADAVETELEDTIAESASSGDFEQEQAVDEMADLEDVADEPAIDVSESAAEPAKHEAQPVVPHENEVGSVKPAETPKGIETSANNEDTLRFDTEAVVDQEDGGRAPASGATGSDARRDSPEMDKIRKILDDLA